MSDEPPLRIISALDHFGRVPETKLLFSDATDAECRLYAVLTTFDYRRDCEIYEGRKALVKATGWSLRKVADVLTKLDDRGAIRRERRGRGHPNSIYLLADLAPDDGQDPAHQADDGQETADDGQDRVSSPLIEREQRDPAIAVPSPRKPKSAKKERADALTRAWWESREPRPLQPFIAVRGLVEKMLNAGHTTEAAMGALRACQDDPPIVGWKLEKALASHRKKQHDPRGLNHDRA